MEGTFEEAASLTARSGAVLLKVRAEDGKGAAWRMATSSEVPELSDEVWSSSFGRFQRSARELKKLVGIHLDLSLVEWADPLPALSLCTTLTELMASDGVRLRVTIGEIENTSVRRGGFLKFMVQQGFLDALWFPGRTTWACAGERTSDKARVISMIESSRSSAIYSNSRCLTAKVGRIDEILTSNGTRRIDALANDVASSWLREIDEHCLRRFYERDPELISIVQVKLRIILLELLLNAHEHAYRESSPHVGTLGLFIRIRRGDGTQQGAQLLQRAIVEENSRCPTLGLFHRSSDAKWLEIFVVDNGVGIAYDIQDWVRRGNARIKQFLKQVKSTTNVVAPMMKALFSEPISRLDRQFNTTVTGLQHISLVLTEQFDFVRLNSMGEWCGNRHPWSEHADGKTLSYRKIFGLENTPVGTAWHLCLRLIGTEDDETTGTVSSWTKVPVGLIDEEEAPQANPAEWVVFDERDLGVSASKLQWEIEMLHARPFSIWLPGPVTKQHIREWVLGARAKALEDRRGRSSFWLLADLAPHEAKLIYDILSREKFKDAEAPKMDIYLVTYTWHSIGLAATATGFSQWHASRHKLFSGRGSRAVFELLRHHDSDVFWADIQRRNPSAQDDSLISGHDPFLSEEVIWRRDESGTPDVWLDGYLDVTEALSSPRRAAIARRALRRCWYALENQDACVASDELLVNLLPREKRAETSEWYAAGHFQPARYVLINSVCVTGQTISEASRYRGNVLHLLRHTPRISSSLKLLAPVPANSRVALEWRGDLSRVQRTAPGMLPYERIPGTPYVGRGGAKAIPMRRFHRPSGMAPGNYFEQPIYPTSPQETYDQFDRLGILKLGHWNYGPHHQLLGLNLGKAVTSEALDRGPLIQWFLSELERLAEAGVSVVIYPSHRVSETLVAALKRHARESDRQRIPQVIIPVHYLGRHSQTSIRIPSLTYDRIKQSLKDSKVKKAAILDDAAVTGKAQREFEQLLRNAGAEDVYVLAILNRTGLPLYRNYLVTEYGDKQRYYWRWDVPTLGSGRHCPLCRAIGLARSLHDSVFSTECNAELSTWIDTWTHVPADTHWERRGLVPGQLPNARLISFGKEWIPHGAPPVPYKLSQRSTTGLAASVAELIRVTAYKDVGLKIGRNPSGRTSKADPHPTGWQRAAAEVLLTQTLLFLEDLEFGELEARMGDLVNLLLDIQLEADASRAPAVPVEIQQLMCLTLLLAPREIMPGILARILARAGTVEHASTLVHIAVGVVLRNVPQLDWDSLVERVRRTTSSTILQKRAFAFLSRSFATIAKKTSSATSQSCLVLFLVLGTSDQDAHSGLLRRLLLAKKADSIDAILRDLHLALEALNLLPAPLFLGSDVAPKTQKLKDTLSEAISKLEAQLKNPAWRDECAGVFDVICRQLYQPRDGWVQIRGELAPQISSLVSFLRRSPSQLDWSEYLAHRARSSRDTPTRWFVNGRVQMPQIRVTVSPQLDIKQQIFCPPLAFRMIHDYLLNVLHATRNPDSGADLVCHLAQVDKSKDVELTLTNLCTHNASRPEAKLSEQVLLSHTEILQVEVLANEPQGQMKVKIRIPHVHSIWKEVTK